MKICMLTSSYPKYPGESTAPFIEEIAAGLVRRGHTVHVVAPFHRDVRRAPVERGVHLHFFRYSPIERLNVWGYAESLHADISVKGRTLLAAPLAVAASVRALLRVTSAKHRTQSAEQDQQHSVLVSSPRAALHSTFDLIHAHWVLPNAVPAALVARLRGLPLVISLHGSDIFLAEQAAPLSFTAGAAMRSAAMITACSGDLRKRAVRLGAVPQNVEVIPYGVDPHAFRPDSGAATQVRAELGLPADAPLILTVSRLVYKKGLTYLLEALPAILAQHPCAVLVMAGYGDLRDELEQRADELGVAAHVHFPGQLERERTARFISAADVYVVPSVRDQRGNVDGLPNALLEGMGEARPIVASCVAGIPEVITNGEHGLLVPERDPAALAAAVSRLLSDRALAQRLGAAARHRITTELTWDQTAARFEAVYQRAVGDKVTG